MGSEMCIRDSDEIICEIHKDDVLMIEKIRDILQENSLGIPLMVDMELCEPSWATKHDFQVHDGNVVFGEVPAPTPVEEYIDWS